jgi:hypothetical protein
MRFYRRSASPSARPINRQHHPPTHLSQVSTPARKDHASAFMRVRSMGSPSFEEMALDKDDTDAANLLVMLHNCPSPAGSFSQWVLSRFRVWELFIRMAFFVFTFKIPTDLWRSV